MLRRFGSAPAVRLITYDETAPVAAHVDEIATQLCELVRTPRYGEGDVDRRALDDVSASALARRLAGVLERVAR